jgi:dephospho-CoA kinase
LTAQAIKNKLWAMVKSGKKPVIGILGGVCSGKSTVAGELAKLGCAVIDADEIAHQLLDEEDVRAKVVHLFGKEILNAGGKISRSELANRVFSDTSSIALLNGILHPLVLAQVEQRINRYNAQPAVKAIVLDMPLLVEVGWEKRCDRIIFVDCRASIRLKRARKMGVFDARMLKIRENLQISLDKKKRIADNIVDNNSDLSSLSKQIVSIFSSIADKG